MTPHTQTLQCSLHLEDNNVHIYFYQQPDNICYNVFSGSTLLFFGGQYHPSPMHPPFSLSSVIGLLASIMPSPGELPSDGSNGTQEDNATRHTDDQFKWFKAPEYPSLFLQVNNYENGNQRQKFVAANYFRKGFVEYIHPPVFNLYQAVSKQHYCPIKSWYAATIPFNHHQKHNLVRLLVPDGDARFREALLTAIEDNFRKVKKHREFETVLIEGKRVTFNNANTTSNPDRILWHLIKPYLKNPNQL
jgi:hypothetical protein